VKDDIFYLLELNIAVFLFGGAGLFGKILNYQSTIIVFSRVFFSAITLFLFIKFKNFKIVFAKKQSYLKVLITSFLLSLHWVFFFQSIKYSTVATALLSFSTFPIFVSFIEPFVFKTKILFKEIIAALLSLLGVLILTHTYSIHSLHFKGVLFGIFSGLLFALLSVANKKLVKGEKPLLITFYQHLFSTPILLPSLTLLKETPTLNDFIYFILLGSVFTALAHLFFISSLIKFKAFISGIFATLEPVYGTLFAFLIIREIPTRYTVYGGIIILIASFYAIISSKKGGHNGV